MSPRAITILFACLTLLFAFVPTLVPRYFRYVRVEAIADFRSCGYFDDFVGVFRQREQEVSQVEYEYHGHRYIFPVQTSNDCSGRTVTQGFQVFILPARPAHWLFDPPDQWYLQNLWAIWGVSGVFGVLTVLRLCMPAKTNPVDVEDVAVGPQ